MNREERVRILIDYLKKENTGYALLADPVDYTGRRRLLRRLMNVRARQIRSIPGSRMNC